MNQFAYVDEELDQLREYIIGRTVVKTFINEGEGLYSIGALLLDDDTLLLVKGKDGCSCTYGEYTIAKLETTPNAITSVEYDEEDEKTKNAILYVFCDDQRYDIVTAEGRDNGYYGTGFKFQILQSFKTVKPDQKTSVRSITRTIATIFRDKK